MYLMMTEFPGYYQVLCDEVAAKVFYFCMLDIVSCAHWYFVKISVIGWSSRGEHLCMERVVQVQLSKVFLRSMKREKESYLMY